MNPAAPASLPLRDIHLPSPPSWWPPAPGWWLLAGALLLSLLLATWLWFRWRRRAPLRSALRELQQLRQAACSGAEPSALVARLSMLLRRIALLCHPERRVACLSAGAWLRFLDEGLEGAPFSSGPGRALAEAPYRPQADTDLAALFSLAETWIVNQFNTRCYEIKLKLSRELVQRRGGGA